MAYSPEQPYNDLPTLPVADVVESRTVLKKAVSAAAALAELRGAGARIPNPGILINTIGLQEARLSSEIENIVTTNDAIYQAESNIHGEVEPATKEVLRYRLALWHGYRAVKAHALLTTNLFVDIARIVKDRPDFDIRRIPGTKVVDAGGATIYTPPLRRARHTPDAGRLGALHPRRAHDRTPGQARADPLPVRGDPSVP